MKTQLRIFTIDWSYFSLCYCPPSHFKLRVKLAMRSFVVFSLPLPLLSVHNHFNNGKNLTFVFVCVRAWKRKSFSMCETFNESFFFCFFFLCKFSIQTNNCMWNITRRITIRKKHRNHLKRTHENTQRTGRQMKVQQQNNGDFNEKETKQNSQMIS